MKKLLIFISGIIVGIVLTIGASLFFAKQSNANENLKFFETPTECVTKKDLEVFQVLGDGYALAWEIGDLEISTGLVVLISDPEGKSFYDDQKIKIPKGKCARQVGVYKYITKNNMEKTVPVVEIME